MIVYPERRFGKEWANNWGSNRKLLCTIFCKNGRFFIAAFKRECRSIAQRTSIIIYIYICMIVCVQCRMYIRYTYVYIYIYIGVPSFEVNIHDPGGGQLHRLTSTHWAFLRLCPSIDIKHL